MQLAQIELAKLVGWSRCPHWGLYDSSETCSVEDGTIGLCMIMVDYSSYHETKITYEASYLLFFCFL